MVEFSIKYNRTTDLTFLLSGDESEDSSQAAQLVKDKTQKSLIEAAVVEFNLKPDKGIKLLEKQGILAHEPVAIAKFLLQTPGLNKTLIGEYLGHHEEFHIKVRVLGFE